MGAKMLKTFLAIEVDASGAKVEHNSNRVLFEGGKASITSSLGVPTEVQLTKSKLAQVEGGKYLVAQGQFPVIHISFKDVYSDACDVVKEKIKLLYPFNLKTPVLCSENCH
jgi:hypothetical protein